MTRPVMLPSWVRTMRFQIAFSLGLMFVAMAGSAAYGVYQLDLRRHDYEILNLSGQLRVTSAALISDARAYLRAHGDASSGGDREDGLFRERLQHHVALYDQIINSFVARRLDPELTGKHDELVCKWDPQSRSQLQRTANDWHIFRFELFRRLSGAADGTDAVPAAAYIVRNGDRMTRSSRELARSFQVMMEQKLASIHLFNQVALVLAAVIMTTLLVLLYRHLVQPLRATMAGFARVAWGDLTLQVPVHGAGEIRQMTSAFNQLIDRLNALFQLTDRITHGSTIDDTLRFVVEEFRGFLPLAWVGLFLPAPDGEYLVLDRQFGDDVTTMREGLTLSLSGLAHHTGAVCTIDDLRAHQARIPADALTSMLVRAGFGSAMLLRTGARDARALLVFAAREPHAYRTEHEELLSNVAGQLTHALDRTVFMEGLVVSAVQGLAKLAESRDPETGEHLARMARYATLLAEELGRGGPYQGEISSAYVRAIHRFAPMHDIGKVGIPDDILCKAGPLTHAERLEMQRHTVIGAEVLRQCEDQVNASGYSIFRIAIDIAEGHHEHFDGTGYPAGLAGHAIPLAARIVSVADVFDALTSRRPYKEAWSVSQALEMLDSQAGRQFDPVIVAAFHRVLPDILAVHDRFHDDRSESDQPAEDGHRAVLLSRMAPA